MELGNRIKEEREKLNMSQDELAQRMNISRQAISKWETGISYPDIEKILKLSEIFNLSLDELVKGDKNFQNNLIKEGKTAMSGLTILGYVVIALGIITCVWGGGQYPVNMMDSDFMSFLISGLFLVTIGIAVIRKIPFWLILGAIYLTGVATIIYMLILKMPMYSLLAGIIVIVGLVLWLSTKVLKSNFYTK